MTAPGKGRAGREENVAAASGGGPVLVYSAESAAR